MAVPRRNVVHNPANRSATLAVRDPVSLALFLPRHCAYPSAYRRYDIINGGADIYMSNSTVHVITDY